MKNIYKIIILLCVCFIPLNIKAMNKTETVYSTINYKGEVKKTIVNTKLTSIDKGDIVDYSSLENIKNLNGNEMFSRDSSKITWKSTGKDIYYQGIIIDNLPISISSKYYLNGEEVNPNKIVGKKGIVKIVFNFINNDYDYNYQMYVPYVVDVTGSFNNKNNSNFSITNGKNVSLGEKTICTAIAAPGLYKSTRVSEFSNLDEVVLTYDTNKFEMGEFYFVITPKLLSDVDLDFLDQVDNKLDSINTLSSGSKKLVNGSLELYNGSIEFNDGLIKLNEGIKSALDGSNEITNGLSLVNENTSSLSSLTVLVDRLYETYNNNLQLLQGIESGETEQQLRDGIENATREKNNLENSLLQVNGYIAQLEPGEDAGVLTSEQIEQLSSLREQKTQLEDGISRYEQGIIDAQNNLAMLPAAKYKILGANEVISQVLCGILHVDSLDYVNNDTINVFKENIDKLVGGVNSLYEGSNKLSGGLLELYNGSNKLVEGSTKLSDGTKVLHEGINKLDSAGISKLSELAVKGSDYSSKLRSLTRLSKNYSGYGCNNSNTTIFIYKMT